MRHENCFKLSVGVLGEGIKMDSIFDLSPAEKLQLVEDLWDDLAGTPETVPVHDWQKEELARRKANLMKNPASGLSWPEIKRRVRSYHGR
jgi:putative addiction module component (TIGR02574 family)